MQLTNTISKSVARKTLKDFIPLILAFFGSLVVLALYQNFRLYTLGVLDSWVNKSFLITVLHHTGFTSIVAIFLAFLFNFMERRKFGLGLKTVRVFLACLLTVECGLIEFYIQNYEILEPSVLSHLETQRYHFSMLHFVFVLPMILCIYYYLYRFTAPYYRLISGMYPFTIILFSLFLATLYTNKKPINENKTQHLLIGMYNAYFDFNKYEGTAEFPLLKSFETEDVLGKYFVETTKMPNVVIIILDGIGSDFVGKHALYKGFTPCLDSLTGRSLYWENFLSNSGESAAALPTIVGSLPFGQNGFTNIPAMVNRNTLYSVLKNNGYTTSFNYGGNSALNHFDKFLDEEHVDLILDKKGFGTGYALQEKDAAGITLGYPDKELFKKFNGNSVRSSGPKFDIFLTLSTKDPYAIPNAEYYADKAAKIATSAQIGLRAKKVINQNTEIFSSVVYADEAIKEFLKSYRKNPDYSNTLFIVTGSHNNTDLPQINEIGRYRVPFMMFGPLLKTPHKFHALASHADIAPSMISFFKKRYEIKVPEQAAWLGQVIQDTGFVAPSKEIPLFRNTGIQDFIFDKYYVSSSIVYQMNEDLNLIDDIDAPEEVILKKFRSFKAVNRYVTENNKIIPAKNALFEQTIPNFSKSELIWVESIFNGGNYDNAYKTASELAHRKEWDRALLLCRYILSEIPRHADSEILMGRIYAWQNDFEKSMGILEGCIKKYPEYVDGYSALLDTYFWAGANDKAQRLLQILQASNLNDKALDQKIARAKGQIEIGASLKETQQLVKGPSNSKEP